MTAFTDKTTFSATLDSKGRVTVPAWMRNSLGLEAGDEVTLSVAEASVDKYSVEDREKALELLSKLDNVKEFSFSNGELKVVRNG